MSRDEYTCPTHGKEGGELRNTGRCGECGEELVSTKPESKQPFTAGQIVRLKGRVAFDMHYPGDHPHSSTRETVEAGTLVKVTHCSPDGAVFLELMNSTGSCGLRPDEVHRWIEVATRSREGQSDEDEEQSSKDSRLGDVLWRSACIDDALREGYLTGRNNYALTEKGQAKLRALITDGFEPDVSDNPGDQEQAARIYALLDLTRGDDETAHNER